MSHMRTSIKCNCGQRVSARDVVQHGYYLRAFAPSFVCVKFRCSRCKKLGEQFIKQEEWENGILRDVAPEATPDEREQFVTQGPISIEEELDFHFALENLGDLKSLDVAPPAKKPRTRSAPQQG